MRRYIDADLLLAQCRRNPLFEKTEKDKGMLYIERSIIDNTPTADVVEIPEGGIGNLSDGYHTFNELYHHRAILFSVICNSMPEKAWKSKLHDTGDMFDGMFIVGIETPEGQATYHYDIEPYWDIFKVKELEKAPKWDGHTPQDAIDRIAKISADVVEVVRCEDCKYCKDLGMSGLWCEHPDSRNPLGCRPNDYCNDGERRDDGT
jgi:hypothetical protein